MLYFLLYHWWDHLWSDISISESWRKLPHPWAPASFVQERSWGSLVALYPDLQDCLHAHVHMRLLFVIRKLRSSCWFGDMMVMSHGFETLLGIHHSLPTLSLPGQHSLALRLPDKCLQWCTSLIQAGGETWTSRGRLVQNWGYWTEDIEWTGVHNDTWHAAGSD